MKKFFKFIIIFILVIVLLVGAIVGTTLFVLSDKTNEVDIESYEEMTTQEAISGPLNDALSKMKDDYELYLRLNEAQINNLIYSVIKAKLNPSYTLSFEHSYPFCWRCDTPLIYYAREAWFINMTSVKDDLIRNNDTINWIPESIGKGRFGDWLKNVQDWGVSRDRYWGTPLPIWECECGHRHAIGSIEELKKMSTDCPDDIELHRPYISIISPRNNLKEIEDLLFEDLRINENIFDTLDMKSLMEMCDLYCSKSLKLLKKYIGERYDK